jgi:hypothetical protein
MCARYISVGQVAVFAHKTDPLDKSHVVCGKGENAKMYAEQDVSLYTGVTNRKNSSIIVAILPSCAWRHVDCESRRNDRWAVVQCLLHMYFEPDHKVIKWKRCIGWCSVSSPQQVEFLSCSILLLNIVGEHSLQVR